MSINNPKYSFTKQPYNYNAPASKYSVTGQKSGKMDLWLDAVKFFEVYTTPILKGVARTFCQVAAKYSPPGLWKQYDDPMTGKEWHWGLGKSNIANDLYYCRIVDLIASQKDRNVKKRPRKEDFPYIEQGYRYKVITTKYKERPHKVLGYYKNIKHALHAARILNRGLAKYSWGTLLNSFQYPVLKQARQFSRFTTDHVVGLYETEMPNSFRMLQKKSPNLKKYRWGYIKVQNIDMQNGQWQMLIRNRLNQSEQYCAIAAKMGVRAALGYWNKISRAINNGMVKSFQKLLQFEINKVFIKK